jgi:dihydrofolate reductase
MNIIVCADNNWGIGKEGKLLCHIHDDMVFFRGCTLGKTVVMGRKTLESLPGGKPLAYRRNIVMTRNEEYEAPEGVEVVHSVDELSKIVDMTSKDVFVIGGAEIYSELFQYCNACYVTKVYRAYDADRYFRDLDVDDDFHIIEQSKIREENGLRYRFVIYERKEKIEQQPQQQA